MQLQVEYEVSLVSYYFSVYKTSYHWNDNDPHNFGLHVTRTVKYLDVTFSKWEKQISVLNLLRQKFGIRY